MADPRLDVKVAPFHPKRDPWERGPEKQLARGLLGCSAVSGNVSQHGRHVDGHYHCSEGYYSGFGYPDGYYSIQPTSTSTPFPVRCIMGFNGRTFIQYRMETPIATVDFNRSWAEYRDGFGLTDKDHWLGLEKLYHICKPRTFTLKIEMKFGDNSFKQQYYYNFYLSDEADGYRMYFSESRGNRMRPIGDCLTPLKGSAFSTYDRDNDNDAGSCAVKYGSGFWFDACAECNPNGRLLRPLDEKRTNVSSEVFWTHDLGDKVPYRMQMWLTV
ncbi:angiopoietin-1-like [Haliotis rubra]|uniref:angiopoietin-1-like n=1 Tax=Haliotis rubra TaxID=36100 RepID=UPI001EE521C8|nr:angiopoietin-1-like [Haliotis rubra]